LQQLSSERANGMVRLVKKLIDVVCTSRAARCSGDVSERYRSTVGMTSSQQGQHPVPQSSIA
jgi:hypothetical protein